MEELHSLIEQLKSEHLSKGVVLSKARTSKNRVTLACSRGGVYRNKLKLKDDERRRKTHTKLIDCPFKIIMSMKQGSWRVREIQGEHNHNCTENIGIPTFRRPNEVEKQRIRELGVSGVPPKAILSTLRPEFGNYRTTAREVYNELTKYRAEFLAGRSPIQALIDHVSSEQYTYKVLLQDNVVVGFFFAHNDSISIIKRFPTTFLIDCTYKTNKFGMPLLNIVGITSTYRTFNSAFAFLHNEEFSSYNWALEKFAEIVKSPV